MYIFSKNDNISNEVIVRESLTDPSSLIKVAQWVLSSPFQSPRHSPLKLDTIEISESEQDSSIVEIDKNDTSNIVNSKNTNAKKVLPKHRFNIFGNRVSLSSSNNTDNDKSNNASKNKIVFAKGHTNPETTVSYIFPEMSSINVSLQKL